MFITVIWLFELINKMSEILIVLSYYMKNGGQSLSLVMILCDS